jgi:Flp pilus assembly pilin Flp
MKNWIMNFIADERGAETTELSVTGVVVAGGAVTGFISLKEAIKEKQDAVIEKLGAAETAAT